MSLPCLTSSRFRLDYSILLHLGSLNMNADFSFRQLVACLSIVALFAACLVGCDRSSNTVVEQDELTSFLEKNPEAVEYDYSE
jgi:hypothetical protein